MDGTQNNTESIDLNIWLDKIDDPSTSQDTLCRIGFVKTLTSTLINLPTNRSIVTGVFGPWGSGKSWLLEQLGNSLTESNKQIKVCRFEPWELKSQDQILAEFFTMVREAIPNKDKHKSIIDLWEQLEQLSIVGSLGAGTIASALAVAGASNPTINLLLASKTVLGSLSQLFEKAKDSSEKSRTLSSIKEALTIELHENLDHPIVVLIDDMDRLTDQEIQMMIRLINTTANLPQIHYVIFGDRKQIASALNPICGNEGDRYLEKIIHHQIQVPEPSKTHLQMRLAEGLKIITSTCNADFDPVDVRFQNFWKDFISLRVLNLRDTHRLLRTVFFHASTLSREGHLEVDLLDLLGIDFLRLFDPESYQDLANGPLIENIMTGWQPIFQKDSDGIWLVELIKNSSLSPATIAGVIVSLFPNSSRAMSKYLESQQLTTLDNQHNTQKLSPLAISRINKTYIYFQLELAAGDIPQTRFQAFIQESHDRSTLSQSLSEFKKRGWLNQLCYRLRTAPEAALKQANTENILHAVSQISDRLEYEPSTANGELESVIDLIPHLIEAVKPDKRDTLIRNIIVESQDVTLSLLLIEYLRHTSGCKYQKGITAPTSIPKMKSSDIEELADSCLANVSSQYCKTLFMRRPNEALRAYRMAHALGPKRTEQVMQKELDQLPGEQTWKLLESIATSMVPEYRINWMTDEEGDSDEVSAHADLLRKRLLSFASNSFWAKFVTQGNAPTDLSKRLAEYLQTSYKKARQSLLKDDSPKAG